MDVLEKIKEHLQLFRHAYDDILIVNPLSHQVLMHAYQPVNPCYAYFNKTQACRYCVAMRAMNTFEPVYKFEQKDDRILHVSALPYEYKGRLYLVELMKDVTDQMGDPLGSKEKSKDVLEQIHGLNEAMILEKTGGVYNRRYTEERLPVDYYASQLDGKEMSLLLVGIEDYQVCLQKWGNQVTEELMNKVAGGLMQVIRGDFDWVARYDRDRFLVVLQKGGPLAMKRVTEKILDIMADLTLEQVECQASMQIGVGGVSSMKGDRDLEELMVCLDENLELALFGKTKVVIT